MGLLKKNVFILVCLMAISLGGPLPVHAEDEDIDVVVNGRLVVFDEVSPRYANARVMVPVAPFCAAMGAQIVWDAASQDVFIYLYDRYVWLQSTNMTLYYGNYAVAIDGSEDIYLTSVISMPLVLRPDLADGRLVAPLSSLVTALGGVVTWDGETETAFVIKPPYSPTRYYEDVRDSASSASVASVSDSSASSASVASVSDSSASSASVASVVAPAATAIANYVYTSPGFYQLITADSALAKYNEVDPFIVICYDSTQTVALREAQRAAADEQTKVYGLDMDENTTALPFMTKQSGAKKNIEQADAITVYFLSGTGRVTVLNAPDYDAMVAGIRAYWEND